MEPFDYMKALSGMWNLGGEAFLTAQQNIFRDTVKNMGSAPGDAKSDIATAPGLPNMAALTEAGQDFAKLWASAVEISKATTQLLQRGNESSPIVTEMLGKIFDPRVWFTSTDNMEESLNHLAEGPRLADMWVIERKFGAMFNAWVLLRQRNLEHNKVILDAWMQATSAFTKSLNEKADRNETLKSWKDLMAVWVEIANRKMLETQRTEPYLASQRELLKASTDLRLAQREVAEFYSELFGYPTRAELDDVHKTVTELRRELRALRRAMSENKPVSQVGDRASPTAKSPSNITAARGRLRGHDAKS